MLTRWLLVTLVLLLAPLAATAQEQIPIKDLAELKGNWSGEGGLGPFGGTSGAKLDYTIKEDGTFSGVLKNRTGQPFSFQGDLKLNPDGSLAASTPGSTGVWRLFNVNGQRVIRMEGTNRRTGQSNWGQIAPGN